MVRMGLAFGASHPDAEDAASAVAERRRSLVSVGRMLVVRLGRMTLPASRDVEDHRVMPPVMPRELQLAVGSLGEAFDVANRIGLRHGVEPAQCSEGHKKK
jgi:hypothetical protein